MSLGDFQNNPHRRYNPLLKEWVLVSPQRTQRPWQGKVESQHEYSRQSYDLDCYLCPGNTRACGAKNPQYDSTYIFENDYPALLPTVPVEEFNDSDLLIGKTEKGICRVGCFSPRHDLAIPLMAVGDIRKVVDLWAGEYVALGALPWVTHVQIFENRGALMGASNPHPHCQIWANATIPDQPGKELESGKEYLRKNGSCLLCDYLNLELKSGERVVCQNRDFIALVPYWAIWPFEILLLSKQHRSAITDLSPNERDSLADILKRITTCYDNVFETSFPYSMGFHQCPTDDRPHPEIHFHAHYYPPLLRSANVQKFMVGYELLGNPQRDITAEDATARLRDATESVDENGRNR